jgi:hypothetical protein
MAGAVEKAHKISKDFATKSGISMAKLIHKINAR